MTATLTKPAIEREICIRCGRALELDEPHTIETVGSAHIGVTACDDARRRDEAGR